MVFLLASNVTGYCNNLYPNSYPLLRLLRYVCLGSSCIINVKKILLYESISLIS
nr:MAG TPA: hypothetical protein [Caudoviricetes sp.]